MCARQSFVGPTPNDRPLPTACVDSSLLAYAPRSDQSTSGILCNQANLLVIGGHGISNNIYQQKSWLFRHSLCPAATRRRAPGFSKSGTQNHATSASLEGLGGIPLPGTCGLTRWVLHTIGHRLGAWGYPDLDDKRSKDNRTHVSLPMRITCACRWHKLVREPCRGRGAHGSAPTRKSTSYCGILWISSRAGQIHTMRPFVAPCPQWCALAAG